jgi:hypothetical protein
MGPMMAAKQQQQQHPSAVLAAAQGLHDRTRAGTDSAALCRTVQSLPAGCASAGHYGCGTTRSQVASVGVAERLPAVSTGAARAVAAAYKNTTSVHATNQPKRKSAAAGGSTPEPWYPGGASYGPATTSSNGGSKRTSDSSTSSSYRSTGTCFSGF